MFLAYVSPVLLHSSLEGDAVRSRRQGRAGQDPRPWRLADGGARDRAALLAVYERWEAACGWDV